VRDKEKRKIWYKNKQEKCGRKDPYFFEFRNKVFDIIGKECVECKSQTDLQIDHIDPSQKKFNISVRWSNKNNWDDIVEELKKCQPLCKECHKKKSGKESSIRMQKDRSELHGTHYQYKRYKCRCEPCRNAQSEYKKKWRESKGQTKRYNNTSKCGEYLNYKRGCKCNLCRAANVTHSMKWKNKRPDGEAG
jgi:hypothetical protein